jgi:hypothetical protein
MGIYWTRKLQSAFYEGYSFLTLVDNFCSYVGSDTWALPVREGKLLGVSEEEMVCTVMRYGPQCKGLRGRTALRWPDDGKKSCLHCGVLNATKIPFVLEEEHSHLCINLLWQVKTKLSFICCSELGLPWTLRSACSSISSYNRIPDSGKRQTLVAFTGTRNGLQAC